MVIDSNIVLASFHKDRDIVVGFCERFNQIYLYGAGLVSSRLITYLEEEKIDIDGIIVSDNPVVSEFHGYSVKCVDDVEIAHGMGIIIAVSEKKQKEILEKLSNKSWYSQDNILCQKIFDTEDMFVADKESYYFGTKPDGHYFDHYCILDQYGRSYGTDKCSEYHSYLRKYEFILNRWRNEKFTLLELGVFKGESLGMWGQYFANAEIIGVDINPECKEYEVENKRVLIKDLSKVENLIELKDLYPRVIVDDASHWWSHQIKALITLFPALENGGIFIVEDIGTSFGKYRKSTFADAIISTYEFCRLVNDIVTGEEPTEALYSKEIIAVARKIADEVDMVCFFFGSVVIIKK